MAKKELKYTINRKARTVTFMIGEEKAEMSFDDAWAFIYLLPRKLAASHRA